MNNPNYFVHVCCMTFNHASYVTETMNGFCMQKTTFPFICTIFDDASTDGEPVVIQQYLQEHFDLENSNAAMKETDAYSQIFAQHKNNKNCYFLVLFLKYNHYSKGIGRKKLEYIKEWIDDVPYVALCEGDDYWIDSLKLKKQVDFFESHPECTMACNRTKKYSEKDKCFIEDSFCMENDGFLETKDAIRKGGLYISTCSLTYRSSLLEHYPDYCKKCHVGDYPLQIMAAVRGRIYYMNDSMSVYRVNVPNSWTRNNLGINNLTRTKINGIKSEVFMLRGFMQDNPQYSKYFQDRISFYINFFFRKYNNPNDYELLRNAFVSEINQYPFLWTIHYKMIFCKNRVLNFIYYRFIFKRLKALFY